MLGEFVCPIDDPRFSDTGPIENHLLVVPFQPVEIQFNRAHVVVADRTRVLFYNRGTCYRREALNKLGDRSLWFAFDDEVLENCGGGKRQRPFNKNVEQLPLNLYLKIRNLYLRIISGQADSLEVEEDSLEMLTQLLRKPGKEIVPSPRRQRQAVVAAEAHMARNYTQPVRLAEVATAAACSPYHLSRIFCRLRGIGIHQYLSALRLRAAVDRLQDSNDSVTDIAMHFGFSSPSHFSKSFRDNVGISPSRFRQQGTHIRAIS